MNWLALEGMLGSYADDELGNHYECIYDPETNHTYELYVDLKQAGLLWSEQYLGRFADWETAVKAAEEDSENRNKK